MPRRESEPCAFLVRHGKDTLSDTGIFVSWIDAPLTSEGKEQAEKVADFLSDYDIKRIYSSPLQRCVVMAQMYADEGVDIVQHRGLLPLNRGILTGTLEELGKPALDLFLKNPDIAIPYGESRTQAERRIESFFNPALSHAESEMTVFFTHHSVIDILNCLLKGERPAEPENLVKPGGIVGVYVDGDGYRLEALLNEDEGQKGIS